ncbi:MAG TPA: GNAT family N-acetyltransferase [Rhodothermales bacterium]|nr:GNAT family N-acetyltransferase [Rhodothermales bacterium]
MQKSVATSLFFRSASRADVPALVALLADDALGVKRERFVDPLPQAYYDAFAAIDADPNNLLLLAESPHQIVGMLQITFIPYLTYQGGWRALIEGVRVAQSARGQGIGKALLAKAIDRARAKGCHLVQLTTDKTRTDALAFYERLGFRATHEGMKLHLSRPAGN